MIHCILSFLLLAAMESAMENNFKAQFDGTTQKYTLCLPAEFNANKAHDLLIAFHGHASDRRQYIKDNRGECKGARDVAAKHSMIYVSPDYRGNSWMGPAAEADMVQLIGELKTKYKIARVFLVGGSMGGTSALIFTALHPNLVDGVSSQNGIADLTTYRQSFAGIDAAIQASYGKDTAEYRKRSPVFFPEKFTMPVAITVGEKDNIVPPASTLRLAEAIQKKGNKNVLVIARKNGGHATNYDDTVKALEFVIERAKKK
ncbi:MAG: hypothetical protein PCFJNLEI_00889 [Verrucomicrobiae bacterium]|nr:hypothetical protein [Verrucomicrobiae bacterium]